MSAGARPPVVLVGLDCPTGLQTARVFHRRGIEVIALASNPRHPCARTRSCVSILPLESGEDALVETLMRMGLKHRERPVLIPCTDLAVLAVARHRTELALLYRFAIPEPDVTEMLLDKVRFARFAQLHDFPIPRTFVVSKRAELEAAAAQIEYPCVLKPSIKTADWTAHTATKAWVEKSRESLLASYDRLSPWASQFVLQEWIAGTDQDHYTCDCYVSAGAVPLATFTTRKIRQWPPGTGQGCLSVEHRDDEVRELTLRVLATAGHYGQGYLETKRDARTGRPMIVEANVGRPTGRAAAAERAGVELLMSMYCDLVGEPLPAARTQKFVGTKWIHLRKDLQAAAHILLTRRGRIRDVVRPWRGPFAFALWSTRDPVPFFADWAHAFGEGARRPSLESNGSGWRRRWARWLAPQPKTAARDEQPDGDEAKPGIPSPPRASETDFHVQGLIRVRARDAWPDDMSALARHLGTSAERTSGAPDVVICFVDELAPHVLERVERTTALGDDGVFHLHPRTGRPLGHLRLSDPPGSALLVVQRGLGYVPLLATALDLAALAHDWIPIPASPWRSPSTGVLVAGWRDGSANGDSVDAERRRAFLSSDGERMLTLGPGSFGAGVAAHERAGGGNGRKAPEPSLQMLVLVEPHDRDHVVAQRIPAAAAADWLADAVEAVLHGALGYRGESAAGLAGHGWYAARRAPHIAARLLRSAVQSKACYMVRYPTGSAVSDVSSAIESVLPTQRFDVLVTHPPAAAAGAPHGRRRSAPA